MPTLVLQHHDIGSPGRLGEALRDHGHRLRVLRPDLGQPLPADLDDVEAVVALGGPQNVDDPPDKHPWLAQEIDLFRAAHEAQLPVVGVCLGAQLIAAALGGRVEPMGVPEIGFVDVQLTAAGQTDVTLAGIAWSSPQFSHHSRHVAEPPPGATLLASSQRCAVQAFRAGLRTYAFQYHFEADADMIRQLLRSAPEQMRQAGVLEEDIDKQLERSYAAFDRLGRRLCENIAELLAPSAQLAARRR
ncbi:MAG: type 1 glutamine amidotransferase [Planctomycetota bacterium]|nr:MAG: type 1 glutamine amidotransferase [Planctomycetota bacterium]